MAIIYTKHAERRLAQRQISKDWVETTIAAPDREIRDPTDPRLTRAYKKVGGSHNRVLRVVYMRTELNILIITAFPDRDAE